MRKKSQEKREKGRVIANNIFMLRYLMRHAPLLVLGEFFFCFATSYPWTMAEVWLGKYVIDVVTSGENIGRIAYAVGVFAIVIIVAETGNNIFFEMYVNRKHEELFFQMQKELYYRAAKMDMSAYDDPKFYNDFVLAMESADEKAKSVLRMMKGLVSELVAIVSVAAIVASIDMTCFLLIILSGLLMLPLGSVISKMQVKRREALMPLERKNQYFMRLFYLPEYAKELRMNDVCGLIKKRYDENAADTHVKTHEFTGRLWKLMFCQETLPYGLIVGGAVVLLMGWKIIVKKEASAGDFVATFNGALTIGGTIQWLATWFSVRMRENGLFIEKFRKFVEYEPKITDGEKATAPEIPETISIENVSFRYEGNEGDSLENISMKIEPCSRIALVGYNGAGKTTLTNLLLRLYDVSSGSIKIGGVDIREQTLESHKKRFAAVFQDYRLFAASIGENVAMQSEYDSERVTRSLKSVRFDVEQKGGCEKVMLKEFDEEGLELSGGEAQKVAIARAFYKQCPYIILDEPSANLDPMAEYELNNAISEAARNKTVIFISHRLSTTRMADKIYMMENGSIAESGTHEELMALNGKYAEMFNIQAEKYREQKAGAYA